MENSLKHPDVTTTEQGQSYCRRKSQSQLKNLIFTDMLAVTSNQHLIKIIQGESREM